MDKSGKAKKRVNMAVLGLVIGVIMVALLGVDYLTTTTSKRNQAYQTNGLLIEQVRSVLLTNKKKEQSLVDSLKEDYIAKAKAVSYIIDSVPSTENDIAELIRIATLMSIDEIHIFDESGRIYGGTVPPYYGFTFDSGEQMAYFKPMLSNKALSMCQDVTPNTAEGKSMMYAICWNDRGTRMTQIGIEPHRLIEEMRTNELSEVIADMPVYDGVDILVADRETGEVLGATTTRQIGSNLSELGLNVDGLDLSAVCDFSASVSHKASYCSASAMDNYVIAVVQARSAVDRDVPITMLMVFLYLLLAAFAITLIVGRMTNRILAEQAYANTDAMTGFYNRRAYESDIARLDKASEHGDLVYISIDLNSLKETNDTLGHEAGDELLLGAAECMQRSFGGCGKLYRIGGDEFVALIDADEQKLEALRQGYEQDMAAWTGKRGNKLSTANGYVRVSEFPGKSMAELARLADERMYAAKSEYYRANGRDRRKR